MAFSVGRNIPGYLPESDPDLFEDWGEARDALGDLLERASEFAFESDLPPEERAALIKQVEHWQFWLPMAVESDGVQVYYFDGEVYWLELV